MSKYDVESLYDYCINLVKANIDDKVNAINLEKDDDIVLECPAPQNYLGDYNNKAVTPTFFLYHTILGAEVIGTVGTQVALEVNIMFYVAFIDVSEEDTATRKGLRYTRALQEIFTDNFANNSYLSDFEIFQHAPQSAQFENTQKWYKIGGVEIKGTIVV